MTLPAWWDIEDLIYPSQTIICMSPRSPFLVDFCRQLEIILPERLPKFSPGRAPVILTNTARTFAVALIEFDNQCWNRDPPVRTMDSRFISFFTRPKPDLFPLFFVDRPIPRDYKYSHFNPINPADGAFYLAGEAHHMNMRCYLNNIRQPSCIGFHTIPLAGGNLITARRFIWNDTLGRFEAEQKPVFIVGKNVPFLFSSSLTLEEQQIASQINPNTDENLRRKSGKHFVLPFTPG